MTGRASIHLRTIAGDLAEVPAWTMLDVAKAVEGAAVDEARRQTGDGRMSGIGRRGAKLRAVHQIVQTDRGNVICVVKGVPAGGWSMLTDGARPHDIGPRKKAKVMAGDLSHPVWGKVKHPGMRGRDAWRNVTRTAGELVPRLFAESVHKAVS